MAKNKKAIGPVQVAAWLSQEEVRRLDEVCENLRNTRSGIVRLALDRFLEKPEVSG